MLAPTLPFAEVDPTIRRMVEHATPVLPTVTISLAKVIAALQIWPVVLAVASIGNGCGSTVVHAALAPGCRRSRRGGAAPPQLWGHTRAQPLREATTHLTHGASDGGRSWCQRLHSAARCAYAR